MTGLPAPVLQGLRVLLCDADDNLFPSEAPAFEASAEVTNRYLGAHGIAERVTAEGLRSTATGRNFRSTAESLTAAHGVAAEDLGEWVAQESTVVTEHLRSVLSPDPAVRGPLTVLGEHLVLAAVSSSSLPRLEGSFTAAGLTELIPAERRFSAEDSLSPPVSKPDPAVYRHACARLGIDPGQGLAVEDSVAGATSAVRAGCPTVGNLTFVREDERAQRRRALAEAGVLAVVTSWQQLVDLVVPALSGRTAA